MFELFSSSWRKLTSIRCPSFNIRFPIFQSSKPQNNKVTFSSEALVRGWEEVEDNEEIGLEAVPAQPEAPLAPLADPEIVSIQSEPAIEAEPNFARIETPERSRRILNRSRNESKIVYLPELEPVHGMPHNPANEFPNTRRREYAARPRTSRRINHNGTGKSLLKRSCWWWRSKEYVQLTLSMPTFARIVKRFRSVNALKVKYSYEVNLDHAFQKMESIVEFTLECPNVHSTCFTYDMIFNKIEAGPGLKRFEINSHTQNFVQVTLEQYFLFLLNFKIHKKAASVVLGGFRLDCSREEFMEFAERVIGLEVFNAAPALMPNHILFERRGKYILTVPKFLSPENEEY